MGIGGPTIGGSLKFLFELGLSPFARMQCRWWSQKIVWGNFGSYLSSFNWQPWRGGQAQRCELLVQLPSRWKFLEVFFLWKYLHSVNEWTNLLLVPSIFFGLSRSQDIRPLKKGPHNDCPEFPKTELDTKKWWVFKIKSPKFLPQKPRNWRDWSKSCLMVL